MTSNDNNATATVDATGFEAFGMCSQLFTGGGILVWLFLCAIYPYSWRGGLPRFTHKSPSVIVGVLFLFIAIPLHTIASEMLPVSFTNDPASLSFVETVKTMAKGFIFFHLILTLIRIKWTTAKWQALVFCEIGKTGYAVWIVWGLARMESSAAKSVATGFMIPVILALFMVSAVRLFYAVKCKCETKQFNHVYFGTDAQCPMKRTMLMCWVPCDKPPADGMTVTAIRGPI